MSKLPSSNTMTMCGGRVAGLQESLVLAPSGSAATASDSRYPRT
jgi:hypothetical protein